MCRNMNVPVRWTVEYLGFGGDWIGRSVSLDFFLVGNREVEWY